jgi:hypothetical protein
VSRTTLLLAASLLLPAVAPANAAEPAADPAALLFSQRCSTCHNIGGGDKVGPDLLGVSRRREKAWFGRFVRAPGAQIDAGEPSVVALWKKFGGVRMPDQALTDVEVDGVWAYFVACTDKGGCQPVPLGPKWGTDATAEEIAAGKALFFGEQRLRKGGAPCFTCHDVREAGAMGGGTLGRDLTFAYARLGEKGMEPLLAEMSSPVMHAAYAEAALEADERFAMKGYLAQLARDGALPRRDRDFFWLGLEGMGIVLAGQANVWARPRAGRGGVT